MMNRRHNRWHNRLTDRYDEPLHPYRIAISLALSTLLSVIGVLWAASLPPH